MLLDLLSPPVADGTGLSIADAVALTGGLSTTSKMPCASYSLPASACGVGSRMRDHGRATLAAMPSKSRSMPKGLKAGAKISPCTGCYARKGNYVRPSTAAAMQRRLDAIYGPRWVDAMVVLIAADGRLYFRWHDSGDVQSVDHLVRICEIAERLPLVCFWLPTQERRIVRDFLAGGGEIPANLVVRFSAPLIDHAPSGDVISSYVVANAPVADGAHSCPAPQQDNACGDCRACWSPDVKLVAYHVH